MRKLMSLISILIVLILAACSVPGVTPTVTGAPASANFSGAKGLFTSNGTTAKSIYGRSIVTSTAAQLGAVTSTGSTQTVTFTDSNNNNVTATVNQAMQLNSTYVLLSLSWTDTSGNQTGLFSGDLATGALASIAQVPDNWPMIWATSDSMYYESGGSIWSADLATGMTKDLSDGSATWNTNNWTKSGTSSWAADTWTYADAKGNVYAISAPNSSALQAVAITPNETVDVGNEPAAWQFWQDLPGTSYVYRYWALADSATQSLYVLAGDDVWDDNPYAVGGSTLTGMALKAFPVTFDPSSSNVISIATVPVAYAMIPSGGARTTHIGADSTMQKSILTDGPDTFGVSVSNGVVSVTRWDTSTIPVSNTFPDGSSAGSGGVTNWRWSGGSVFVGPTAAHVSIHKASLPNGGGTANAPAIVTPKGSISTWSVVGGQVFYTDSSGTWQYDISTGATTAYAGAVPTAVTQ